MSNGPRRQRAEPARVRSVRAVGPERGAVGAEDAVEQECLDGRDSEFVVDVDERDARREVREVAGRSSGTSWHG